MSKLSGHLSCSLLALFAATLLLIAGGEASAAGKTKIVKKTTFDPNAQQVELFSAMSEGKVASKLVLQDSKGGQLLLTNNTQQPLNVAMPKAMVGVQVLKQQFGGGNQFGGGAGGLGGGGAQTTGGGIGGAGGGFGNQGGGNSFGGGTGSLFSIPPSKTLSLNFNSVCLEHGKTEPAPRMEYTIAPVKTFSEDPVLERLLVNVSEKRIKPQVAQAVAWHLSDDMSWGELAAKSIKHLGGRAPSSYFTRAELVEAQQALNILGTLVRRDAAENEEASESEEAIEKPETAADRVSLAQ